MHQLPVYRGGEVVAHALVDRLDWVSLSRHRWALNKDGYVVASVNRRNVFLHRAVLGLRKGDGLEADHISGDKLDNTADNLRIGTRALNGQNVPAVRGARGVTFDKRMKSRPWRVRITLAGRSHQVGYFATEDEAAVAADAWYAEHMPFSNPARHRAAA